MQGYYITKAEIEALCGCSPLACRVYHLLRYKMDLRSGLVGQCYRISHAALIHASQTHIPRGAGVQIVLPSIKEMRGALAQLVRVGLIEKTGDEQQLIFRLIQAKTLDQTGQSAGSATRPAKPRPSSKSAPSRQPTRRIQGRYQHTGLKNQRKAAAAAAVDKSARPDNPPADSAAPSHFATAAGDITGATLDQFAQQIGYPIKHHPASVARLRALHPNREQLATAILAAVAARKRDHNPAPLNIGFIACFLTPPRARPAPASNWKNSWSGILAHAQTLGITPEKDEHPQAFRARVEGVRV